VLASDCSPLPFAAAAPIAASTGACEPHSLTVTTRIFGNAARSSPPVPDEPKAARFLPVSGTSHSIPSTDIKRHGPRNAPIVSGPATRPATGENPPAIGSGPSRCRAWVIPPGVGSHTLVPGALAPQRLRQPGGGLLIIIVSKQGQRHHEIHHHM